MKSEVPSAPSDRVGFFVDLLREVQLYWRLLRHPEVPGWTKAIPLLTVLYLIFPLDVIVDPLLGLGQLDDLAVLILGMQLFVALAPAPVVQRLRREIRAGHGTARDERGGNAHTVDATYRVVDEGAEDGDPGSQAVRRGDVDWR